MTNEEKLIILENQKKRFCQYFEDRLQGEKCEEVN